MTLKYFTFEDKNATVLGPHVWSMLLADLKGEIYFNKQKMRNLGRGPFLKTV